MPRTSPASVSLRVSSTSSRDGSGSPLGWLWQMSTEFAFETTAGLNTSRGYVVGAVM